MKFVFAKSHRLLEPDWWLCLDSNDACSVAERRSFRSTIKSYLEPLIFHDLKSGIVNSAAVVILDVCSKAMAQHTMALIFGPL